MTEIVGESLIADQNAMLADRLAQDYEHLAGQLQDRGIDVEKITNKAQESGMVSGGRKGRPLTIWMATNLKNITDNEVS